MTLLDLARTQLDAPDPLGATRACWLGLAALEERVDALLADRGVDPGPRASVASRFSCLEVAYADEPDLVARASYAWTQLSEACHQHAYRLSPTYAEARGLLDAVGSLRA